MNDEPEMIGRDSERRMRAMAMLGLAAIVVAGAVFRSFGLGARTAFDEAASWHFALLPWDAFWEVMWRFEGNSVAYYLLLRGWLVLGNDLVVMRSMSVLFGVATLVCVYFLGTKLFNRRTGLIASLLLAVHSFHIRYSQEARGYALTTLLLVASTLLFVHSAQKKSRVTSVSYVLVSAFACYGHLLSVLVLAAQWSWFVFTQGFGALRSRLWTLAGLAVTTLPTVWYAFAMNGGQIDWIKPLNRWRFLNQVTSLVGGDRSTLLIYGLLGTIAIAFALLSKQQPQWRRHTWLVFGWLTLPVAVLVLISPVKSMFIDRYLLMCVPALVLLAGVAVDRLLDSGKVARVIGGVLGLIALGVTANASIAQYQGVIAEVDALKDSTRYVATRQQSDDAVFLFTAATYFPYVYYATVHHSDKVPDPESAVVFPNFDGVPSGLQPNPTVDQIRSAIAGKRRIWLMVNKNGVRLVRGAAETEPVLHQVLLEDFVLRTDETIGAMEVFLYERRDTVAANANPTGPSGR